MAKGILFDETAVRAAVEGAENQADALRHLGIAAQANNFKRLREACVRYGLPIPTKPAAAATDSTPPTARKSKFSDHEAIRSACGSSVSANEVLLKIGVSASGKNYDRLITVCEQEGITLPEIKPQGRKIADRPDPSKRALSRIDAVSHDDLALMASRGSASFILKQLKLDATKESIAHLRARLRQEGLAATRKPNKKDAKGTQAKLSDAEYFREGTRHGSASMKKRLRASNLIPHNNCAQCGIGRIWKRARLELQLDHINGVTSDNRLENLRFLCPNCHSQTDTFCKPKSRLAAVAA